MGKCFVCEKEFGYLQRSHVIGNRRVNRKLYGNKIIDSKLNILLACSLHHNSLIDLGSQRYDKERVAQIIESDMELHEKREAIEAIVRENIKRKRGKV